MPGFESRSALADHMTKTLDAYLTNLGFTIQPMGYENFFDKALMQRLRTIHNNKTVQFARYMPDNFVYFNNQVIFWLEYKICNTPIWSDSRVKLLQSVSGDTSLSKDNIGAIETAGIEVYKGLADLGIAVVIIVFSNYHKRDGVPAPLVVNTARRTIMKHQDNVVLGAGNASRTPFTNVNLNEFMDLNVWLQSITKLPQAKVDDGYQTAVDSLMNFTG